MTPGLVSQCIRNQCKVFCRQEGTACFTLASVANCLSSKCFVRDTMKWKSLGPILKTGLVNDYIATVWSSQSCAAWCFPSPLAPQEVPVWQTICDIWLLREAIMRTQKTPEIASVRKISHYLTLKKLARIVTAVYVSRWWAIVFWNCKWWGRILQPRIDFFRRNIKQ